MKINFQNSKSYSNSEFDKIIYDVVVDKSVELYEEKMHSYILQNYQLSEFIQQNLVLNKKLFNTIQKSTLAKLCLITEPWCLDACIILPLLRAVAVINPNINIQIYTRDSQPGIMRQFLTNGSESIPVVFGVDEIDQELFRWGPRSEKAKKLIEPIMNEPYSVKSEILTDFYRLDLTQDIQEEWININLF
jgi:hypothetical protein